MLAKQVLLSIFQSLNILFKISPFAAKEAGAKLCGLARVVVVEEIVRGASVKLKRTHRGQCVAIRAVNILLNRMGCL